MSANLAELFADLPENLGHHVRIVVVSLAAGVALSLPLGVAVARRPRLRAWAVGAVSVIQTVPSLALLALMVPLLAAASVLTASAFGFELPSLGFVPTVVALTLYSMLPMVRNTVTGLVGVPANVLEAATAMGMTRRQSLTRVELPLAAPVILAGVRTATVWTVGMATLATPVGQRCLGNYIFAGLQTRNGAAVVFGCVAAAALALVLDALVGVLERAMAARSRAPAGPLEGVRSSSLGSGPVAVGLALAGLLAVVAVGVWGPTSGAGARVVTVGAKTFTEQYILAELLSDRLMDAGYDVEVREGLGSTVGFDALVAGDIDVFVDYSGTLWANHMGRVESADRQPVLDGMTRWLREQHGIVCLGSLGFENAYGLAVRREAAEALGLLSIADLAVVAPGQAIGGDYEFFERPEWAAVRDAYGLAFADEVAYDSRFMYAALEQGDVFAISAFTSDGWIEAHELVVLTDPLAALPPYDAVLLVSGEVDPSVVVALQPLVGAIDVEIMRRANYMVDRDDDKRTVGQAAEWIAGQIAR